MRNRHHVVIIGGGFGGLFLAHALRGAPVRVTLIDQRNFHLFQPLLYQVATGGLSPANIAMPLRRILRSQRNARVVLGEVTGIDVENRRVIVEPTPIEYDTLVVATGARHNYFGHPEWEQFAPGLKTIEDATEIRAKMFSAFEAAELATSVEETRTLLTFVIVGAGPTGVELAGTIAEIARDTLPNDFRNIDSKLAQIILIDAADRVLPPYPSALSARAEEQLRELGVTVRTNVLVTAIDRGGVTIDAGGKSERIASRTVLWAAGVQASSLGRELAVRAGAPIDRVGRVIVDPDLTIPGHPEVFVIGDLAIYSHQGGKPLPGVAPVAMQQGKYVAELLRGRLAGDRTPAPFRYVDRGNMATIGRAAAVADLGWIRLSGYSAWLAWLFVHLLFLIGFQNKLLVLIQWAWSYFSFSRSCRLITGGGQSQRPTGGV